MPRYVPFSIQLAGKRWSGSWHIEGKDIVICSAYGSLRAPLGRAKPENAAARMMLDILRGWVERPRA